MKTLTSTQITQRTFYCDLIKGPASGVIEASWLNFTLLVAIRHFHAPESLKAAFSAAPCVGLLLTPFSLFVASRMRLFPNRASAGYVFLASIMLIAMGQAVSLNWFAAFFMVYALLVTQRTPMDVQIYSQNYAKDDRGRLLSTTFVLASLSGGLFGYFGGDLLDKDLARYPAIFALIGVAGLVVALAYLGMPVQRLDGRSSGNPWQNFGLARSDKLFGYLLASWMLLGIGNLMTLPIRIEYIANDRYGIDASNRMVAIIIIAIPLAFRILSTRMWGNIFDRMNLVATRNLINSMFLISIVLFFFTDRLEIMAIGSACFGLASGGGGILWSLWVTKIAPEEKVPAYQSVHSALTGVRGIIGPFLGYAILVATDPRTVSFVAATAILISTVLFWRVRKHERFLK